MNIDLLFLLLLLKYHISHRLSWIIRKSEYSSLLIWQAAAAAASATAAAAAAAPPPPPLPALFPPTVLNLDEGGFRSPGFNSRAPHGDQVFNYMCQNLIAKRSWCTRILGLSDIGLSSATDDTDYSDMPELEGSHEDDSMPPLIDELSENIDRVYEELEETNQDSEQDL